MSLGFLHEERRVENAGDQENPDGDGPELLVLRQRRHLDPDERANDGRQREHDQDGPVLGDQVVGVKRPGRATSSSYDDELLWLRRRSYKTRPGLVQGQRFLDMIKLNI